MTRRKGLNWLFRSYANICADPHPPQRGPPTPKGRGAVIFNNWARFSIARFPATTTPSLLGGGDRAAVGEGRQHNVSVFAKRST